jgi:hypothetical protein
MFGDCRPERNAEPLCSPDGAATALLGQRCSRRSKTSIERRHSGAGIVTIVAPLSAL